MRASLTSLQLLRSRVLGSLRCYSSGPKKPTEITICGKTYPTDEWTNVTPSILALTERQLYKDKGHPIGILQNLIEKKFGGLGYTIYKDFPPVVSKYENFDVLGFPEDHPGRSKTDTYYINKETLLRTHTSAHEAQCFTESKTPGYLICADVYRRDEIDRTHYPGFHQLEGARVWSEKELGGQDKLLEKLQEDINALPKTSLIVEDNLPFYNDKTNPKQSNMTDRETELISQHLKRTIEVLVDEVFNTAKRAAIADGHDDPDLHEPLKVRWVEAYFPWTAPSWEIEVWWKGDWLECCGCGVVQKSVLKNSGVGEKVGWAFGIGLDRIAMLLFGIPDIRILWSKDERFTKQFQDGQIRTFTPYSKYPGTVRDVSFWLPDAATAEQMHENDLMELVRGIGGDLVESVSLVDEFVHPKTNKKSLCYRINYQSMDRNLTNDEVNVLQEQVRAQLVDTYGVELR